MKQPIKTIVSEIQKNIKQFVHEHQYCEHCNKLINLRKQKYLKIGLNFYCNMDCRNSYLINKQVGDELERVRQAEPQLNILEKMIVHLVN